MPQANLSTNFALSEEKPLYYGKKSIELYLVKKAKVTKESQATVDPSPYYDPNLVVASNRLHPATLRRSAYSLLTKQWEGHILEINGDDFEAALYDESGKDEPITAEFSLFDVAEGDRELVKVGALFSWNIGKETKTHGQVKNEDYLIFKRLPTWRGFDVNAPSKIVDEYSKLFESD